MHRFPSHQVLRTRAAEVAVKPLFTGLVELANQSVYYPPLFPCVDDMGDVPAITIPIPVPGDPLQLLPLPALLTCDDETYVYTPRWSHRAASDQCPSAGLLVPGGLGHRSYGDRRRLVEIPLGKIIA